MKLINTYGCFETSEILANWCNKSIFVIWMIYDLCHVDDLLSESCGWFTIRVIWVIYDPYHLDDLLSESCGWFMIWVMWMIYNLSHVDDLLSESCGWLTIWVMMIYDLSHVDNLLSESCGWFTICVIWMIYCEKDYRFTFTKQMLYIFILILTLIRPVLLWSESILF